MKRSNVRRAAMVAALLACATLAHPAQNGLQKVTYWSQDLTYGLAHVITWDTATHIDGVDTGPAFAPRVNWYVDDGEAVKPPPAAAAGKAH